MTDHQIQKPTVFISHASTDGAFASAVKQEIEKVFANGVVVFSTSSPGTIAAGADWLGEIESRLERAQAVIAIVTPISIERPWLWFEVGATWAKGRQQQVKIYPLCAPEIDLGHLPSPLDRLQALSMGKAADLKLLFQAMIAQCGFGTISTFRASNITARIPKYKTVKIKDVDLNDYTLYSGKYTGYSDEELMEVIDTEFLAPDERKFSESSLIHTGREDLVHNGKLVHFRQIDRKLDLPPGTAKRLLKSAFQNS
jgi:TIR domain-containing protein